MVFFSPNRNRSEDVFESFLASVPAPSGLDRSQVAGGINVGRSLNGGGGSGLSWTPRAVSTVVLCIWRLEMAVVAGLFVRTFESVAHGG